jgi:hypothetical protein
MSVPSGAIPPDLWAITTYFNPVGYKRRLANYRVFRRHLNVPLVAVELSFGGPFELEPDDADILIQLRGTDVLWQKERLFNIAFEAVPKDCDKIAWLDADVLFADPGWPLAASRRLDKVRLLHLFSDFKMLRRDCLPSDGARGVEGCRQSVVKAYASGTLSPPSCPSKATPPRGCFAWGLAWAARREVLEVDGLYDACVLGGGDMAATCAAYGDFEVPVARLGMNLEQRAHYLSWAERWKETVRGSVGCLDGSLYHLWHGDTKRRGYQDRYSVLTDHRFDPNTDIGLDENGCWQWTLADDLELPPKVRAYFHSRQEDR